MESSSTERFTGRVDDYARHRPGYPDEILALLQGECGLTEADLVADVAAGTGLLTQIFLRNGNRVLAIEPNASMRATLENMKRVHGRLACIDGTAEVTKLPDQSADFVTVAQAMHWFDLPKARREFARILQPDGWCVIVYNERRRLGDAFHEGYEALLQMYGSDYCEVQQKHLQQEQIAAFFAPCEVKRTVMDNFQDLDLDGLAGRIASSSYMPTHLDHGYQEMQQEIAKLFERCQQGGRVRLQYQCAVSFGPLHG